MQYLNKYEYQFCVDDGKPWIFSLTCTDKESKNTIRNGELKEGASYHIKLESNQENHDFIIQKAGNALDLAPEGTSGQLQLWILCGTLKISIKSKSTGTMYHAMVPIYSYKIDNIDLMIRSVATRATDLLWNNRSSLFETLIESEEKQEQLYYIRVIIILAIVEDSEFINAMADILENPHSIVTLERRIIQVQKLKKLSREIEQQLLKRNARMIQVPATVSWHSVGLEQIPEKIDIYDSQFTYNAPENQFIKSFLQKMDQELSNAEARASLEKTNPINDQLRTRIQEAFSKLRYWISHEVMHEVEPLMDAPPFHSPIILNVASYSTIVSFWWRHTQAFQPYFGSENWTIEAGRITMDALYERWVSLEVIRAVGKICDRMGADFGVHRRWGTAQFGKKFLPYKYRDLELNVWLQKTFKSQSYSIPMKPDVSINVKAHNGKTDWIHFDAKYRVEESDNDNQDGRRRKAKAVDIHKMHTYVDAIYNTLASFVVFPAKMPEEKPEQWEPFIHATRQTSVGYFGLLPVNDDGEGDTTYIEKWLKEKFDNWPQ